LSNGSSVEVGYGPDKFCYRPHIKLPAPVAAIYRAVAEHEAAYQGIIDRAGARDLVTGIEKGMSNKGRGTPSLWNQNGATSVDDFNPAGSRFGTNFGASSRL
jgi:hypothetical protein